MIDSQNPSESCMCSNFSDPILRAGCENFLFLKWDNSLVSNEEVQCPFELDHHLSCWEENGDSYPPIGTTPEVWQPIWTMDLILLHHLQALHCPVHLQDESHTATTDLMGCSRFTEFGNSYFAGFWCGISKGSCEACNGLWCAPTFSPTMDLVPTSSPTAASPSARPSLRVTTSPTTSSVNS
jgi:hypothetical protein